ncbi:hypothetical protein [Phytohabitans suffuscus]|uniref:Uncharacterized protein n=1 Tax=Phytohabitans suffuscus TaxID=624315 RepID=A0A6F8Z063_9ACTN|nr:hypothetical protein [Phytohabitans suffuscus]BCB91578.1 hypothetical protein Psuf_088910 [Phytohabitans suffuscus]
MSTPPPVTRASLRHASPILAPVPMPDPPARPFTDQEWERVQLGFRARDMDEKWDVFVEDRTAYLHRSWTGNGIFAASFAPRPTGGWRIESATVESDPRRYRRGCDEYDRVMLELVLTAVVLGQPATGLRADLVRLTTADSGRAAAPAGLIEHSALGTLRHNP